MALINKISDIAEAVRERSGYTGGLTLEDMAIEIKAIPYPVVEEIEIAENGTYEPPEGVDGFNKVIIDIPIPEVKPAIIEEITITENGTYSAPVGVDGYSPINVNVPTGGGSSVEVEPILLSGDCSYDCAGPVASAYINHFGDTITTNDITNCSYMFVNSTVERIPFELNFLSGNYHSLTYMFLDCHNLKELPKFNKVIPEGMREIFKNCWALKTIPEDFFDDWDFSRVQYYSTSNMNYMFDSCLSLRTIPTNLLKQVWGVQTGSTIVYYGMFNSCFCLDEVIGLGVGTGSLTSNRFTNFATSCWRMKDFTFAVNEDGTPKTAKWKNQTIDLAQIGFVNYVANKPVILTYGMSEDKEVTNDTTYQALKDNVDWWTVDVNYSRYNHDSAVTTINSLPDCSATGTNTIKFKGKAGALTDGGAINTLTEEEIAVATAKGWTVSLV